MGLIIMDIIMSTDNVFEYLWEFAVRILHC